MGIFFKPPSQGFNPANGDKLRDTLVHSIPPNLGRGNSPFDALWYWLFRETTRALTRLLLGAELQDSGVSPVTVTVGHVHDENQEAALPWLQAGSGAAWWDDGSVNASLSVLGPTIIDQTAETDLLWLPFAIPSGATLAYFKLRVGTQTAGDIGNIRVKLFNDTAMSNVFPVVGSAFTTIVGPAGSTLKDSWLELDPIDVSGMASEDGLKTGWAQVSGLVASAGQKAWLSEVSLGLRQGA